jgi:hypothetical protein
MVACMSPAAAQELLAGVARIEITPSFNGPMYGYANRKCGPSTGTHDPLFAKAVVLQAGASKVALVTMDLGSITSRTLFRRVQDELGIPVLLLSASHTHSAAAFLPGASAPAEPSPYIAELEAKLFEVVKQAAALLAPARLTTGRGSIQLGYNRLLLRDDGRARAVFDNLDRIPYGPVDPEVLLLGVEYPAGQPRALLVHYTAHPVVLGPTNCLYSADYPGVMQARVEAALPGVQAMFVQGAAGETNPLFQGRSGNGDADFALVTKLGELLGAEVLRAARRLTPLAAGPASIAHQTEVLTFQHRWEADKTIPVGITTLLVNAQVAIAAVPGEPFLKMQERWKTAADLPYAFFWGYTQSTAEAWPGYIPDLRSAAYGGYGADASTSIEPGAAERIMDRHLLNLFGLRGMWMKQPGRP